MFIGHYSAALALKRVEKNASLGWLFLAVQFVDIVFFPFVLLGIERLNIVENFTQSTHFELEFLPYTHGLVSFLVFAAVTFIVFWIVPVKEKVNKKRVALVMAAAVFSHWVLDLIVHTPDLPMLGDSSPKLGFGLWNNALITFILEAVLLVAGLWLYLRGTKAKTVTGKYGMMIFVAVLIVLNFFNIFGPPPSSVTFLAIYALVLYFAFGGIAFWLDRKRS
ncbi:MAG: hypothetical protein ACXABY_17200 [Candidatus Thorarchaeota archaeon]|jgi:hypothetical protein